MRTDLHTTITVTLALTIIAICVAHDIIWPCDIGPAANMSGTATVRLYDSVPHRTQRPAPQPVAVVYRKQPQIPVTVPRVAPLETLTGAVVPAHTAPVPLDTQSEVAYYRDCLTDTAAQVRACVHDSVSGSRITWREWTLTNLRPTITATVTDHRPDRMQVYVGPRMGALRPALGAWEPLAGAGLRIKTKQNWSIGASYLHGLNGSQAVGLDADILIRFPGIAQRQRGRRAERLAHDPSPR